MWKVFVALLLLSSLAFADGFIFNGYGSNETQIGNLKTDTNYSGFIAKGSLTDGQPISRNGSYLTNQGQIGYLSMINESEYRSICGTLTSSYTLISDVNAQGDCFSINTNGIVLDCNGHTITGNGTGYGIRNYGGIYVAIKNCKINNFTNGVNLVFSQISTIQNITVSNNTRGFLIEGNSQSNYISNSTANNNYYGVYLGFKTDGAQQNTMGNSSITNSTYYDVYSDSTSNLVKENKFINTTLDKTKIGYGSCYRTCNLSVQWYARVNVTDSSNVSVVSTIIVNDSTSHVVFNNSASLTQYFIVNDTFFQNTGNTYYNNHSIFVNNSAYGLASGSFNFSGPDYTFNISYPPPTLIIVNQTATYGGEGQNLHLQCQDGTMYRQCSNITLGYYCDGGYLDPDPKCAIEAPAKPSYWWTGVYDWLKAVIPKPIQGILSFAKNTTVITIIFTVSLAPWLFNALGFYWGQLTAFLWWAFVNAQGLPAWLWFILLGIFIVFMVLLNNRRKKGKEEGIRRESAKK